ncbi:hypothetical protein K501DRAFT_289279 [Backusella circina FSU 941]|nr:hypothetical protein K501DRAFT_289279 [Backusella circina FSU 941]
MPKISRAEQNYYSLANTHRKNVEKYDLQLQDKGCNQYEEIEQLVKCKSCLDPAAAEVDCFFKDFRAFRQHKGSLRFGYFFPDAIQQRSPLSHSSKRFNKNKPYDATDRHYLKSKLRDILKETIAHDQPTFHHRTKSYKVLQRKDFEEYRHVCDICSTTIFNFHYVCPGCAIDICLHCYNHWYQVKKDPKKTECHSGLKHSLQIFTLSQKYTKEDMDTIMMELDEEDVLLDDSSAKTEAEAEAMLDAKLKMKSADTIVLPMTPDSDDQRIDYIEDRGCNSSASLQESSSGGIPVYSDDDSIHSVSMGGQGTSIYYEVVSQKDKDVTTSNEKSSRLEDVIMTEETSMSLPTIIANAVTLTTRKFQEIWQKKDPLLVENCLEKSCLSWNPKFFGEKYGDQEIEVIDSRDNSKHISTSKEFFDSYESEEKLKEYCKRLGTSRVIKIKDWPPKDDFKEVFNELHDDYMNKVLPAPDYCSEGGFFNISNRLPEEYMPPDLGPKMFISQVNDPTIKSCTKLHCDMADAVNVMCYSKSKSAAAVWDIFASKDLPQLRSFVHKLNKQRKRNFGFDPILSESSYLEEADLIELEKQTGVKPFRFMQKAGDAVFVPAGCAHQVQNITGSIKCAYDFLSPETIQESSLITSHLQNIKLEDKLQLKTTLLYAWKSL